MIIKPRIRGFICTTTHPVGCEQNVKEQIALTKAQGPIANAPKRVLVVGSSSGYGLSSRITAAFGGGASTIGVFFLKKRVQRRNQAQLVGITLPLLTNLQKKKVYTLKV